MSGLLLAWRGSEAAGWGEKLSFSPHSKGYSLDWSPWHGVMIRIEADKRWEPVSDAGSGVSVAVVGRLAWDATLWQEAASLHGQRGCAAHLLLDRWKRGLSNFLPLLNGIALVLVYEAREQTLHLFTDRLGVFPVYISGGGNPVVCSHSDVLADWRLAQGQPLTLDIDTFAQGVGTAYGTPPYTFYQEIRSLDAAAHYIFSSRGCDVHTKVSEYWTPRAEPYSNSDVSYWVDRTAEAIDQSIKRRTHAEAGRVGVFLSGGADSRTMVYAAETPSALTTMTFADSNNRESEVARRIARLSGTNHHLMLRDFEHYGQTAREGVRISGGFWCIKDNHFHGLFPEIDALSLDSVMTGDYADLLLKGLSLDHAELHIGRHFLGIHRQTPFAYQFYQPHFGLSPQWQSRVGERLEAHFSFDIRRNPHLVEDRRVRPLWRESDSMADIWLLRMVPWDPPFTDNAIIDVFDQMPSQLKLNNRVFGRAVNRLANEQQRRIPDNNHGCSVEASVATIMMRSLMRRLWRRLSGKKPKTESLVTSGSWPNFAYYIAHSPVISELWNDPSPLTRECFTEILGEDPWLKPIASFGGEREQLFLRLLTYKLWFDLRQL